MDVAETDVVQQLEFFRDTALVREEVERVGHRQIEHVGDAAALVAYLQRLAIIPAALAPSQGHLNVAGRKCISIFTSPSPWHASQRPPFTLNEKRPGP